MTAARRRSRRRVTERAPTESDFKRCEALLVDAEGDFKRCEALLVDAESDFKR